MTSLLPILQNALRAAGDDTAIVGIEPVPGGCINHVQRVVTAKRSYLFKHNPQSLPEMFASEARGLELLRAPGTLRIPQVYAFAEASPTGPGWMLQEWIAPFAGDPRPLAARLGAGLAALHQQGTADRYGLDHDNYIGFTPQENGFESDWVRFYRERRLRPQIALADTNGWLTSEHRARLELLLERLDRWLEGVERRPALLHGDLWPGNVLYDVAGLPALIDPAAYYGDREAELAYGEWLGIFPAALYAAYDEVWPTASDRADRRDLYNLYHALNHVNHFGERYLGEVERILRHYV